MAQALSADFALLLEGPDPRIELVDFGALGGQFGALLYRLELEGFWSEVLMRPAFASSSSRNFLFCSVSFWIAPKWAFLGGFDAPLSELLLGFLRSELRLNKRHLGRVSLPSLSSTVSDSLFVEKKELSLGKWLRVSLDRLLGQRLRSPLNAALVEQIIVYQTLFVEIQIHFGFGVGQVQLDRDPGLARLGSLRGPFGAQKLV